MNGRNGTIIKINNVRHQVEIDNIGLSWVTRTFCTRIPEPLSRPLPLQGRNPSRLLNQSSPSSRPTSVCVSDESSTTDNTSVEVRHGPETTTQVLIDLLAHSIADMNLDDHHVDKWTLQLRPRIIHFRHGPN
jgi:hypothetical protein